MQTRTDILSTIDHNLTEAKAAVAYWTDLRKHAKAGWPPAQVPEETGKPKPKRRAKRSNQRGKQDNKPTNRQLICNVMSECPEDEWTIDDIVSHTSLTKEQVHPLLSKLVRDGAIDRPTTGMYKANALTKH